MDTDFSSKETTSNEMAVPGQTGRPPPIILTSTTNLIQLQKQLLSVVKRTFEFQSTRIGTRVITSGMADFQSVKSHFDTNNLSYYLFYSKSEKHVQAVIGHMPHNSPAKDISDGLVSLGFDVISIMQMTAIHQSPPVGSKTMNRPLIQITLPRTAKSQEIFQLPSLWHIVIRVQAHRVQTGLRQCRNCQQFGHVWANCKRSPRCLWCCGGHQHKECPKKRNTSSARTCCNCHLAEEETPTWPINRAANLRRRCRK
jgi:hypothetical protein